ncbi:MAG: hypothetical protein P4M08_04620 [Oligoflexia bacterium]|nr:hypothetical protein [Oligoflexia bacterium]
MKLSALFSVALLSTLLSSGSWAAQASAAPKAKATRKVTAAPANSKPNVLDFDADVIEGKKETPDLFIQLGNQQPQLDSLMYGRENFNDFQMQEAPWRPNFHQASPNRQGASRKQ